jgi:hypothetical protein
MKARISLGGEVVLEVEGEVHEVVAAAVLAREYVRTRPSGGTALITATDLEHLYTTDATEVKVPAPEPAAPAPPPKRHYKKRAKARKPAKAKPRKQPEPKPPAEPEPEPEFFCKEHKLAFRSGHALGAHKRHLHPKGGPATPPLEESGAVPVIKLLTTHALYNAGIPKAAEAADLNEKLAGEHLATAYRLMRLPGPPTGTPAFKRKWVDEMGVEDRVNFARRVIKEWKPSD